MMEMQQQQAQCILLARVATSGISTESDGPVGSISEKTNKQPWSLNTETASTVKNPSNVEHKINMMRYCIILLIQWSSVTSPSARLKWSHTRTGLSSGGIVILKCDT